MTRTPDGVLLAAIGDAPHFDDMTTNREIEPLDLPRGEVQWSDSKLGDLGARVRAWLEHETAPAAGAG